MHVLSLHFHFCFKSLHTISCSRYLTISEKNLLEERLSMKTTRKSFALFNTEGLGNKKSLIRRSLVLWNEVRNENSRYVQRRKLPVLIRSIKISHRNAERLCSHKLPSKQLDYASHIFLQHEYYTIYVPGFMTQKFISEDFTHGSCGCGITCTTTPPFSKRRL